MQTPEQRQEYLRAWRKKRFDATAAFLDVVKSFPCLDCGRSYPSQVMEFDHVHGVKLFNVSSATQIPYALDKLRDEIAKCVVRCANCHRIRHLAGGTP